MCVGGMRETIDHLFLYFDAGRLLWNDVLAFQHMDWMLPRCMEDVLKACKRKFHDKDSKLVWDLILRCIVWSV